MTPRLDGNAPAPDLTVEALVAIAEPPDLVDRQLVAQRLGVSINTVDQWKYRGLLPEPDYPELANPIWKWETIETWAEGTSRLPVRPVG